MTTPVLTAVGAADRPRVLHAVVFGGGTPTVPGNAASESFITLGLARASFRTTRQLSALQVSVLPTARGTRPSFDRAVDWANSYFSKFGIEPSFLHEYDEEPTARSIRELEQSHLVCVPGGDLVRLIEVWQKWDLVSTIHETLLSRGTELVGDSAGLIFLGSRAYSDTEQYRAPKETPWKYRLVENPIIGLYTGAWCPHGDDNAYQFTYQPGLRGTKTTRRDLFRRELGPDLNGLAVDNHTALIIDGNDAVVIGSGTATLHCFEHGKIRLTTYKAGERIDLTRLDASSN